MIISRRCTGATGPAKLILAEGTGHVIATLVFLNLSATKWTETHVIFVLLSPAFQLIFHRLLTAYASMPSVSALEAHVCLAFRAGHFFRLVVLGAHVLPTVRFGAPAHQRVGFEGLFVGKSVILLDEGYLALTFQYLCQSRLLYGFQTFGLEALDFVDISSLDLLFEHLHGAVATKTMLAIELYRAGIFRRARSRVRHDLISVADGTIRGIVFFVGNLHLLEYLLRGRSNLVLNVFGALELRFLTQ